MEKEINYLIWFSLESWFTTPYLRPLPTSPSPPLRRRPTLLFSSSALRDRSGPPSASLAGADEAAMASAGKVWCASSNSGVSSPSLAAAVAVAAAVAAAAVNSEDNGGGSSWGSWGGMATAGDLGCTTGPFAGNTKSVPEPDQKVFRTPGSKSGSVIFVWIRILVFFCLKRNLKH
jgi:hypothetical protein